MQRGPARFLLKHVLAFKQDRPRCRRHQAGYQAGRGALAAARFADNRYDLTPVDREGDIFKRVDIDRCERARRPGSAWSGVRSWSNGCPDPLGAAAGDMSCQSGHYAPSSVREYVQMAGTQCPGWTSTQFGFDPGCIGWNFGTARMKPAAGRRAGHIGRDCREYRSNASGRRSGSGTRSSGPACTDAADCRRASAAGASSTILPAYMIAMRSENSTSKERSCVMKRIEKPSFALRSSISLHDLLLHDDIERGGRLVHDHHGRMEGQGHGDHGALAHPARELVRVGIDPVGIDADDFEEFLGTLVAILLERFGSCARIASMIWSPTRSTGLSAFIALCMTMEISRPAKLAQFVSDRREEIAALELHFAAGDHGRRVEAGAECRARRSICRCPIRQPGQRLRPGRYQRRRHRRRGQADRRSLYSMRRSRTGEQRIVDRARYLPGDSGAQ